jgi:glycolate oxidase FAD binding subunit
MDLTAFADEVGADGAVTCVGGRTQWEVGGPVDAGTREVLAPGGVEWVQAEEMTVRCGAATTVADLDAALAEHGQCVALPDWPGATVGGVLAVGRSGVRRLGYGPVRDALLQAGLVMADGGIVKAGGPTVKNVSGYDLCRLLVGSLGTLAFIGEVILRTRPRPAVAQWYRGGPGVDPFEAFRTLYRPASILWDGTTTWALLEGHPVDVAAQAALVPGLVEVEGHPPLPTGGRRSLPAAALRDLAVGSDGGFVHCVNPIAPRRLDPVVAALHARIKAAFDPTARLNPGRLNPGHEWPQP